MKRIVFFTACLVVSGCVSSNYNRNVYSSNQDWVVVRKTHTSVNGIISEKAIYSLKPLNELDGNKRVYNELSLVAPYGEASVGDIYPKKYVDSRF